MHKKDLIKKIKALMIFRLILVTIVMVTGSLVLKVEKTPFYIIIAIFYLSTLVYAILLRARFSLFLNAYLQIIFDVLLETAVIHYAGGADSIYAFLYVPSIVAGGVVLSAAAAKTIAGLASVFYSGISALEYFNIIHPAIFDKSVYSEGLRVLLFIVSFRVIIFCLVGYLSGYLSKQLFFERTELQKLKNLSDIILKNISSGVLTLDSQSRVVYANPNASRILDRGMEEIIGLEWSDLFWEEPDAEVIKRFVEQAKTIKGSEIDIVQTDGQKLVINCFYNDLKDDRNKIVGGVLTFVDLTAFRDLELELRQREKLSAMGEMAVSIAHELRNPMASIRGALEVLKEKKDFQGESEKLVEVIFKESDRLNRVIQDFLKYAKEKSSFEEYEDLSRLIDDVWLLIRQNKKWQGNVRLEKELKPSKVMVGIPQDQFKQVLYNLFINALEAMPQGGGIRVSAEGGEKEVLIKITDTGIGISKDALSKIFQRFYSTKSYGLGIGLAIIRRIIESHQGTIEIDSKEEEGTTFIIKLPAVNGHSC